MLLSLKVKNYALIEELSVDFHHGLNIITGETGAGKSILLGALGLILGKRADTSVLSNADSKCIVEAEFNVAGYNLESVYRDNDLDFDRHSVFRREILPSGKSRAFVNDTPVNLTILQELALQLVDIHSQHQNLLLNQQAFLLNIIDKFCGNEPLLNEYLRAYAEFKASKSAYLKKLESYTSIKADIDYLNHQVTELADANIRAGEISQIEQELSQVENAGEIKAALHEVSQVLSADEQGLLDSIQNISTAINRISRVFSPANELLNRLESVKIELKELDADIQADFEKLEFDPGHQEQLHQRLNLLYSLLQKHRADSEEELLEKLESFQQKLSIGIDGEFELETLRKQLEQQEARALDLAHQVSGKRKESFASLQTKVENTLRNLGIEHGRLQIDCTDKDMSNSGIDEVSFLFTANKNHPVKEISKIASGGELSRLMLAVKALLSDAGGMPTIILDEIDTGVSGEIADKVGALIHAMASGMQVINITHLPQVASKGEAHYKVYKNHDKEHTRTFVKKLDRMERLHEIAKMLSGEELTDAALENAKVLLNK
jgi:DNA repair protein RecN (Recombination protein N)